MKRQLMILTLELTEQCNLACTYCYVHKTKAVASDAVIKAVVQLAKTKVDEGNNVCVDVFGGEPLLHIPKVKLVIDSVNALGEQYIEHINVTIFTNATLLTEEFVKYTYQHKFVRYNFSLDGNAECHNSARIFADGSGSYDDTVRGMRIYSNIYGVSFDQIGAKYVISPENLKYLMSSVRDSVESGRHNIYAGLNRDAVWTDADIVEYERVLQEVADYYIENVGSTDTPGKMSRLDLFTISVMDYEYRSTAYCGAGKNQLGIAPNGDIYPCQRFYNNRSPFILGNVFEGLSGKWYTMIKSYDSSCFSACNKCDTFKDHNCLGQCLAACHENGNIFKAIPNVCKLLKVTYKVARYVEEHLRDNPVWQHAIDKANYGGR